ncbi:hypothetical protein CCH79_00001956, partial [Gambusia affinis]
IGPVPIHILRGQPKCASRSGPGVPTLKVSIDGIESCSAINGMRRITRTSTDMDLRHSALFGCYESLAGGNTGDAVVDFSGAVAESIDLQKEKYYADQNKQDKFFEDLLKVWNRGGIISASISVRDYLFLQSRTENGLVRGHAYSVTDVKRVRLGHGLWAYFKNETIPLIRLRNPWGKTEWTGAWSDSSEEWSKVGDTERGNLGITVADDGEFWWVSDYTPAIQFDS